MICKSADRYVDAKSDSATIVRHVRFTPMATE